MGSDDMAVVLDALDALALTVEDWTPELREQYEAATELCSELFPVLWMLRSTRNRTIA
jgi:hypothetical protein